jgi:uncharacterized protein (TIGR03437 family)
VYPGQINAVAPQLTPLTTVDVVVTTGCETPGATRSAPESVTVATATPEFLYFVNHADGQNPVAAQNSQTGVYVGPAELGAGFAAARPSDVVTIFGSGFGPTNPAVAPGATATGPAQIRNSTITVTLGGVTLDPKDVLYVGAAPGLLISQLNIRIPQGVPAGNQPLQIRIGFLASAPGGYLAIAAP